MNGTRLAVDDGPMAKAFAQFGEGAGNLEVLLLGGEN
jgi:hypothetical protein